MGLGKTFVFTFLIVNLKQEKETLILSAFLIFTFLIINLKLSELENNNKKKVEFIFLIVNLKLSGIAGIVFTLTNLHSP